MFTAMTTTRRLQYNAAVHPLRHPSATCRLRGKLTRRLGLGILKVPERRPALLLPSTPQGSLLPSVPEMSAQAPVMRPALSLPSTSSRSLLPAREDDVREEDVPEPPLSPKLHAVQTLPSMPGSGGRPRRMRQKPVRFRESVAKRWKQVLELDTHG